MLRRRSGRSLSPLSPTRLAPSRLTLTHGLMVVSALLTFVAVSSVLEDRSETVEVLVARSAIDDGGPIRAENLLPVRISAGHPLLEQLTSTATFKEGLARRPIAAGEPLLLSDVLAVGSGASGRTFTLPVDDRVVEGLALRPGDRVDIVGVDTSGVVGIVAFDLEVARLPDTGSAGGFTGSLGSSFVTVEVTPGEVIRLVTALRGDQVEIVRSTGAPALEEQP